jgi:MFS family permease
MRGICFLPPLPRGFETPLVPSRSPSIQAQRQLGTYFGILMLTLGLAEPTGLVSLPLLFWLKDGLGLRPQSIAAFEAVALAPLYFGFVFGFIRDRWRPFGRGDRAYLLLGTPIAIASYCWLATSSTSPTRLLIGVLIAVVAFEFLGASAEGLMTELAQRHLMTGRMSALSELAEIIPSVASTLLGGWIATRLDVGASFLVAAVITTAVLLQALWRPHAVFPQGPRLVQPERHTHAVRRLLKHRALWPAIGALLLWNFSPGWGTPLVFFLTDELKLSPVAFGAFRAATFASGAIAAVMYTVLCRRFPLRPILWWTVALNIPAAFLIFLTHGAAGVVAVSAIVGLLLGMLNIALFDLLRRSCPTNLEGTGIMLGYSLFSLGGTLGDLFGSWMYDQFGLAACLGFDALATIAILPVLLLVPRTLTSSCDGDDVKTGDTSPPHPVLAAS